MKILFLDIDGVLNNADYFKDKGSHSTRGYGFLNRQADEIDPKALALLHDLLKDVDDLNIVISSTWRILHKLGELKNIFIKVIPDFPHRRIISMTGRVPSGHRGTEIDMWRKDNDFTGKYVIVDDDGDMHPHQPFVQTNFAVGLTKDHIQKIKDLL